ncbi:hypothetical protein BH23CHL8_BH23CHL8_30100 [soil metagenome]
MTTRKRVTAKDGEQAIAMLGRERTAARTTGYATEMRRCIGSARFGIEPHEAPVSTFPKQPSRKDGLGLMCAPHWKAYVKGLREARVPADGKAAAKVTRLRASKPAAKATTKRERRRTPMAHVPSPQVVEAEALIAEIDALPGPEHVQRVGDDDVQAALETIGNGRAVETPLGEAIDGGTGEHVADDAA